MGSGMVEERCSGSATQPGPETVTRRSVQEGSDSVICKDSFLDRATYGFFSLPRLYFMFGLIGRRNPPAITHPEFYYDFLAVFWHGRLPWRILNI
jgi:hypothetical protein